MQLYINKHYMNKEIAMRKEREFFNWAIILFSLWLLVGGVVSAPPAHAATADPTYQRIMKRGYIVLGTSPDYAPYEFQTTSNGKSKDVGMDISVAKDIAHDLGVQLKIKNMDFDSLLVGLQTGKVDMVLSGMNPSAARRKSVDFSNVYYQGGQSIIINQKDRYLFKDKNSFHHRKVAAQTGSIQYNLAKKQIKGASVRGIEKGTDLILALQTNKVDGIVMEKPTAEAYAANNHGLKIINAHFKLNSDETSTAVALPKGSPILKKKINQTVARIKKQNRLPKYLKTAGTYLKGNTVDTSMIHYWKYFALGVGYTILISLVGVCFGSLIGALLALMRLSRHASLRAVAVAYVEFMRGTPLMVQLMLVYFGLGMVINLPALTAGMIAVSLIVQPTLLKLSGVELIRLTRDRLKRPRVWDWITKIGYVSWCSPRHWKIFGPL